MGEPQGKLLQRATPGVYVMNSDPCSSINHYFYKCSPATVRLQGEKVEVLWTCIHYVNQRYSLFPRGPPAHSQTGTDRSPVTAPRHKWPTSPSHLNNFKLLFPAFNSRLLIIQDLTVCQALNVTYRKTQWPI